MSWFVLILLSTILFSLVVPIDKYLRDQYFHNSFAYGIVINIIFIPLILLLFPFAHWSISWNLSFFMAVISGPLYYLMWIFYWQALKKGEVSRCSGIFNSAPLFNAFLGVIILGEVLTVGKWLAVFLIVSGAIIISWEKKINEKSALNSIYLLVVLAAIINAFANLTSKFALAKIDPLPLYIISSVSALPIIFSFLANNQVSQEVKQNLPNKKIIGVIFIRVMITIIGNILFYLALSIGPMSLISAIVGTGPLPTLLITILVSHFWPKIFKEDISRQVIFQKALAIFLIVGGVILINF